MPAKVPQLNPEKCDLCGACISVCPPDCIELYERHLNIIAEECTYCKKCIIICPMDALEENGGC
ncbi:MAG: 4Fe-4S ferredoxin [candidate division Zixibacteria bacterium CG_4_9_14_3_um_filter_46_8]|nr:MAG: 4Fe-4S ferredoxin [candidate division Zixibacteria bacterium CG_4_9_14_3_um_filter_46_8]